jgi:HK97 family phage major capsid protein
MPDSAAATLIANGTVIEAGAASPIYVPGRAPPTQASWVQEGAPIPAKAYTMNRATLAVRKIAMIIVFSRELARLSSAPTIFEMMLREDAAASIDFAYFGNQAGTAAQHVGLLNGLTPAVGTSIALDDLSHLAQTVGGTSGIR